MELLDRAVEWIEGRGPRRIAAAVLAVAWLYLCFAIARWQV